MSWYGDDVKKKYGLNEKRQPTYLDDMVSDQKEAEAGYLKASKRGRKPGSKNKIIEANKDVKKMTNEEIHKEIQLNKELLPKISEAHKTRQLEVELAETKEKLLEFESMSKENLEDLEFINEQFRELQRISTVLLRKAIAEDSIDNKIKWYEVINDVQTATTSLLAIILQSKGF